MRKIYHVFVSSTYLDLKEERRAVSEAIAKAGYVPEGMEIFPAASQKQMEFIKSVVDRCDYYILIVGGLYGSMLDASKSFTEAEFDYAIERRVPVLSFFRRDLDKVQARHVEQSELNRQRLDEFKERVKKNSVVDFWESPDELATKSLAALAQESNRNPGVGWVRGDSVPSEKIYAELDALRQANEVLQSDLANMSASETEPAVSEPVLSPDQKFRVRYTTNNPYSNALGIAAIGPSNYKPSVIVTPRDALVATAHAYRQPNSIEPLKRFIEEKANPHNPLSMRTSAKSVILEKHDVDVVAMALLSLGLWREVQGNFQLSETGQRFFVESNIV